MIAAIGRAALGLWYERDPRDRKLFARLVAVVVALTCTHSVLAAMILFSVLDWLVE
jgi:putative copper export protein